MLCILIVALNLSKHKGGNIVEYLDSLEKLPDVMEETFQLRPKIKHLARLMSKQKCIVITADGISYSIAKEAALKIKETSYMNVNATYLGEFMHGHVAVLNNKSALVYIAVDGISHTAVANLEKIRKNYNPTMFIIGKHNDRIISNFNINVNCENEILQMYMLEPSLVILDEIDSGLDVDSLKIVGNNVMDYFKEYKPILIVITHYQRLLDYIKPDYVHILKNGNIVKSGDSSLVKEIETNGYNSSEFAIKENTKNE